MSLEERSRIRRMRMEGHRSHSFAEADQWDLEFWQRQTPDERLAALVAIHRDIANVKVGRSRH